MIERWLPVPGYEGLYEASDLGRVKSVARRVVFAGHSYRDQPENILKECPNGAGYMHVSLCKDGKIKCVTVHKIILETFVGQRPEGMQGCHGAGGKSDNRLCNLRWDTKEGNAADRVAAGLSRGTNNPQSKLDDVKVAEIKARLRAGDKRHEIAADFNIGLHQIYRIQSGRAWTHVQ